MLGLVLATDEGIAHVFPGEDATLALAGPRFTSLDYRDGTGIAAAPGHGVWMHRGREWEQVWEGDASVVRLSPEGEAWLGAEPPRVFRSTDGGDTWAEIENVQNVLRHYRGRPSGVSREVPSVAGIAFPENALLIGVRPLGTWLSRDGGLTWMPRAEGLDPSIGGLWEHPERRDRLYATARSGFFRSEDGGFSWIQSLSGLDRSFGGDVAVVPGTPDTLLLSAAHRDPAELAESEAPDADNAALFRSINGGVAWQRMLLDDEDAWPQLPLVSSVAGTMAMLFVQAGSRAWGSHDSGEHWLPVAEGLPAAHAMVAAL